MKKRILTFTLVTGTLLTGALMIDGALAQTAVLDEVVVTTTRSETVRLDNPGNIATLDPAETVNLFPVELVNRAPGVHIHRGSGQEHLTAIRSPVLVGGAGAGSFLYLEDGIPMRAPGFANVNALMDAQAQQGGSVEVVRGPGSALYGSNAVHGLINFVSAPMDNSERSVDMAYGSYGRHAVGLQMAQQHANFTSRLTLDLNGDHEGYRDQQGFAQQKARLESAWQSGATGYRFSLSTMNLNQETAGYASSYEDEDIAQGNSDTNAYRDATAHRAYLRMTQDLDSGATLTLTPYFRSNEMAFLMHFLSTADPLEENAHDSIGLQTAYARSSNNLSYVAGIDIELTDGELTEIQENGDVSFGGPVVYAEGTHYDFEVEAQVIAPYLHAVWAWGENTQITTGLRIEMTEYDYTDNTGGGLSGKLFRPDSRSDDFSDVSPKFGIVHKLAENRRVFANLARAARAPQVTDLYRLRDSDTSDGIDPDVSAIDSEILDSLEIGYRAVYPGASYELTAFIMQKENYHFRDANDNYVIDGETDHMGVELSISWALTNDLDLQTNLTYAQHEYAFSSATTGMMHEAQSISDGNKVDSAPETLGHTTLTYKNSERLSTALIWEHVGSYFMDASNENEYDGHDIFALNIDYTLSGETSLALRIDNLFDKAYATRADHWRNANRYFPGEERRFMARLSRSF